MTDAEILQATKDWPEPEIRNLLSSINRRRDKVTRIWDYVFGKQPTLYERDRTTLMIDAYGYDNVRKAFAAAGDNGINQNKCLAYIQKVLDNMKQEDSIKRNKAEALQKNKDIALLSGENIRAKPDIGDKGWKMGLLTDNLEKESKMIKEIFNAKEIGE